MDNQLSKALGKTKTILIKPVITHKSTILASTNSCYTFLVDALANKFQIAEEFERLFGAKVNKVRTTVKRSKEKRTKKGVYVRKADQKKAYIYSKDAQIEFFPKI